MHTNHPSYLYAQRIAEFHGSKATTLRGLCRFVKGLSKAEIRRAHRTKDFPVTWKLKREQRKADPEAKRARVDKQFRKSYLARLRREEHKILGRPKRTIAEAIAAIESRNRDNFRLGEIARLRSIVYGSDFAPLTVDFSSLPLIPIETETAEHVGATVCKRGKDWEVRSTRGPGSVVNIPGETEWKNGKPKKYTRARNISYVRSFAVVLDPQTIEYVIHETIGTATLPNGYEFDIDANGLRVIDANSRADDYHVTAGDVLSNIGYIPGLISTNREARKRLAAEAAIEKAKVRGVYVCFVDSLRAGNCGAGTINFCARHNLEVGRHYPAEQLFDLANGNADRVRLAIARATVRSRQEAEKGYCELSDHFGR